MQSHDSLQADLEACWRRDDPHAARLFDVLIQRQKSRKADAVDALLEAIAVIAPVRPTEKIVEQIR